MTGHVAKTIRDDVIVYAWRSVCSCGWASPLDGFKGARDAAIARRYGHLDSVKTQTVQAKSASSTDA